MKAISSNGLREMFLRFFSERGHAVIPSASLIPDNDPTVLFTTAGMHPLVPYLLGQPHPAGNRLVDVQKCVRTVDIDEVGDASHLTFFEMLGNWSLGDYFKKEAIHWSWEFLTSPDWLGIDPDRLAFSVFEGEEGIPRDEEAAALWLECGVKADRIYYLPRENNWWGPAGMTGPCGPDTEMFIITDKAPCGPDCSPACDCGRYLEIWNDVFMQYNKTAEGAYEPLPRPNVDTGMGLERTVCVLNGKQSVYETDAFADTLALIESLCGKGYDDGDATRRAFRIVADHLRTSTFILGDPNGVSPSNLGQGYVLRRLIRRAVRSGMQLGLPEGFTVRLAEHYIGKYAEVYPELREKQAFVLEQLQMEETRFARTLRQGEHEFEKMLRHVDPGTKMLRGSSAFKLYDTYGFPIEMTVELAKEHGLSVDMEDFEQRLKKHQEVSNAGAEKTFKGGLADHSEQTTRLHSATHLLHAALRQVLGDDVAQKGSNITAERLRFDFSFPRKMTPEEVKRVEDLVNGYIRAAAPVVLEEMTVEEARDAGAIGLFASKYGERVRVYAMGDFSKEMCGGPHVENTAELGVFHIQKEEASSAGVRRIRATLSES